MVYTIGVVSHNKRGERAADLMHTVGAVYRSVDNGTLGADGNHKKVWRWHRDHTRTPWAVTLEDDAEPVEDFAGQLGAALEAAPTPVVSLYLGRLRPPQYQSAIGKAVKTARGACWLTHPRLFHAVGVAVRTELVADMVRHLHTRAIDEAISDWCRHREHTVGYCWPSLVEHADIPTLVKHRDEVRRVPGRVAWRVGTREAWNEVAVPIRNTRT